MKVYLVEYVDNSDIYDKATEFVGIFSTIMLAFDAATKEKYKNNRDYVAIVMPQEITNDRDVFYSVCEIEVDGYFNESLQVR
jgi:hypothetical protein